MTDLVSITALAYVNHGRWIAMCPRMGCLNAEFCSPGQWEFFCGAYALGRGQDVTGYCRWRGPLTWPGNAYEINAELLRRPVAATRNWMPAGHPIALAARLPAGQSVAELAAEFLKNDPISAKGH